jgi:CRP-like cAMP-binding protein
MVMWFDTLVDGSISREWVANVGRRDARTRISHLLCEIALRGKVAGVGESTEFELPLTQEQLGDTTGLTAVHVNRTLHLLEAEGLIRRKGSRSVKIVNWRNLAEAGDFESNYLHLNDARRAKA